MEQGSVTGATVHRVVDAVAVRGGGPATSGHYSTGFWVLWMSITVALCLVYLGVYVGIRCSGSSRPLRRRRRPADRADVPSPPTGGTVGAGAHGH